MKKPVKKEIKQVKKPNNCNLEVINEGKYDNMYITLEDGTRFQVKLAFYNRKLAYKVKMVVENGK